MPWTDNKTLKYLLLSSATDLYIDAGDLNKALDFSKKALEAAKESHIPINICTAYDELGASLFKLQRYEQALLSDNTMIQLCDSIPAPLASAGGHLGKGMSLQKLGRHAEALQELEIALNGFQKMDYKIGIGYALLFTASSQISTAQYNSARNNLNKLIPILESLEQWNSLKDAYSYQSLLYEKEENYQSALQWFKKQFDAEKKVLDKTQALQIAKLQVEYEVNHKEQHIEQLTQENKLLALQKQSNQQQSLIIILVLIVIALFSILLWIRAQRERGVFKHMSQIDPLTKLYNHAYCYSIAETRFHECNRNHQPFTVVVADIDWFKFVNDTYGHAAGDKVLKSIADVLKSCFTERGIVGRTGGEEFTCFLPGVSAQQARDFVQNCREQVQPVVDYGKKIEVTLSYGIAENQGRYHTLDTLVRDADDALYKAKRNGRNQIMIFHPKKKKTP